MVDLEARITALEAELSALRAELARPVTHVGSDDDAPAAPEGPLAGDGVADSPAAARSSRSSRPGAGPFEGDETRTIGLVGAGVPTGASGALLNVTATDTTGAGYVQVYSAALTSPPATSNLNWYASGQIDVFGWYW